MRKSKAKGSPIDAMIKHALPGAKTIKRPKLTDADRRTMDANATAMHLTNDILRDLTWRYNEKHFCRRLCQSTKFHRASYEIQAVLHTCSECSVVFTHPGKFSGIDTEALLKADLVQYAKSLKIKRTEMEELETQPVQKVIEKILFHLLMNGKQTDSILRALA